MQTLNWQSKHLDMRRECQLLTPRLVYTFTLIQLVSIYTLFSTKSQHQWEIFGCHTKNKAVFKV